MNEKRENVIIVIAVVSSCLFFVAGYFLGKSFAIADYAFLIKESSFDEKIQGAFCSLPRSIGRFSKDKMCESDSSSEETEEKKENESSISEPITDGHKTGEKILSVTHTQGSRPTTQQHIASKQVRSVDDKKRGYAQLISFSSNQKASAYVEKLKKQGISVRVVDHFRKTKKGKKIHWFQIVTDEMSLSKLKEFVKKIAQKEKLQYYKIIELQSKR